MRVSENIAPETVNVSMFRPHLRNVPDLAPLPHGYGLRLLEPSDEPALAALLSSAFAEPWDEQRVGATLTRAGDVRAVYGVFWQNELAATASRQFLPERDRHTGFVHWLGTHPLHRGKGLAAALLERLLQDFAARGYQSARLFTQPERLPAIRTYLKFGFIPEYTVCDRDDRGIWSDVFQALARTKR